MIANTKIHVHAGKKKSWFSYLHSETILVITELKGLPIAVSTEIRIQLNSVSVHSCAESTARCPITETAQHPDRNNKELYAGQT
jgi:hypothetical protein